MALRSSQGIERREAGSVSRSGVWAMPVEDILEVVD